MRQFDLFGVTQRPSPRNRLEEFCASVANEFPPNHRLSPEELATRFSSYFRIIPPVSLADQKRLAATMGIQDFEWVEIPNGASGVNIKSGGHYSLYVHSLDNQLRQGHTIFHEVFELIQSALEEFSPQHALEYECDNDVQRERDADLFSANVLMPEVDFVEDALKGGLDVVFLKDKYNRSYSSIFIHLARVMGKLGVPFAGLLYEESHERPAGAENRQSELKLSRTVRDKIRLEYRWTVLAFSNRINPILASHLPSKGEALLPGTLARLAFDQCESVFVNRATGFDFFGLEDLSVLVRPLYPHSHHPRKVGLIAVRHESKSLLAPQLENCSPILFSRMRGLQIPQAPTTRQLELPWDSIGRRARVRATTL